MGLNIHIRAVLNKQFQKFMTHTRRYAPALRMVESENPNDGIFADVIIDVSSFLDQHLSDIKIIETQRHSSGVKSPYRLWGETPAVKSSLTF